MDAIDTKILGALVKDARTPATRLAKLARVSREVAMYRLNRLVRRGIVRRFITRIDLSRLGFVAAFLQVSIKPGREEEFKAYLEASPSISWVAEWTGKWSYGMNLVGKDNEEVDARFHALFERFRADILNHRFLFHKRTRFFHEKFLGDAAGSGKKGSRTTTKVDDHDKSTLQALSLDARVDYVTLSKKVPLTAQAIRQRIRKLERAGIIEQYSAFLDLRQLGVQQYSIFADIREVDSKKLLAYLTTHPKVAFVAEYHGDPLLEFGLFVKDPYALRPLLREIETAFPALRVEELWLFEEMIRSIGPPRCVFE